MKYIDIIAEKYKTDLAILKNRKREYIFYLASYNFCQKDGIR